MRPVWSQISLMFLFIVALIGTLLRSTPLFQVRFVYDHWLHTHSHVAFQGWIYLILFLLSTYFFISTEDQKRLRLPLQFKLSVLVVIGILISFAMQGYGLYSILFSSLFQILNYWFIISFFKATGGIRRGAHGPALLFMRFGMLLGALSTLAPYGVGILSAKGLADTPMYDAFIYCFLHFQYSGWFFFVLLGLLLKSMENTSMGADNSSLRISFRLLAIGVVPLYALSLMGMELGAFVKGAAILGASLTFFGFLYLIKGLRLRFRSWLNDLPKATQWLFVIAALALGLKTILQLASLLPFFEQQAFSDRYLIMLYMHLSLIGILSFAYLGFMQRLNWIGYGIWRPIGTLFLVTGFVLNESVLALSALTSFQSPVLLFTTSAMMAFGVLLLLLQGFPGLLQRRV